jgi:alanyl-tRNA synthetase
MRELEKTGQENLMRLARMEAEGLISAAGPIITHRMDSYPDEAMRAVADLIRERRPDSVGLLYRETDGKINYLIFVGPRLVKDHPANTLVKEVAKVLGGGGGGRPHMAEGGGGNPGKIPEAIAHLKQLIKT